MTKESAKPTPVNVVVWGDSIAASGWPQQMEHQYNACCNIGVPIKVINAGKGGNPAARARHEFAESVLAHRPRIVFIQFGFNDQRFDGSRGKQPISTPAEFGEHLTAMIEMCVEQAHAKVVVLGNHRALTRMTMPLGIDYDTAVGVYRAVAAQVAAAQDVDYIDMSQALLHPEINYTQLLSEDGVHLSAFGKAAYARVATMAVMRILQ